MENIVSTDINYSYSILKKDLNMLKKAYPFLNISSVGKSALGNDIFIIKILPFKILVLFPPYVYIITY